jgi:hypothetical protein
MAGKRYPVALAFGHRPGIALGPIGTVHLTHDPLFVTTLIGVPGVFNNFKGKLDAQGRATPPPSMNVPALRGIAGTRIFGAAVAHDKTVEAISNCWGITIR